MSLGYKNLGSGFLSKDKSPYDYYLKALKQSISSMVGPKNKELCEKVYKQKVEEFEETVSSLPSRYAAPNNPDRLLRLACFVSEYVFKDVLATSITDNYGNPILTPGFGVEYYTYDFEHEFTSSSKPYYQNKDFGYYITARDKLWNRIKSQYSIKQNLTKPDQFGNIGVIDFNALSKRLKSDIRTYYAKHPELTTNLNPDPDLQKIFGTALGELLNDLRNDNSQRNKPDSVFRF